jgi:hypothetical protein
MIICSYKSVMYQRIEASADCILRCTQPFKTLEEALVNPWDLKLTRTQTFILGPLVVLKSDGKKAGVVAHKLVHDLLRRGRIRNPTGTYYKVNWSYIENVSPLKDLSTMANYFVIVRWKADAAIPQLVLSRRFKERSTGRVLIRRHRMVRTSSSTVLIFKALYCHGQLFDCSERPLRACDPLYESVFGIACRPCASENYAK